jgi:hypothetical protein
MAQEEARFTYQTEEIFSDIPDDPENLQMTIPPEVAERAGLQPGDPVKISLGDQGTVVIEKIAREGSNDKE